MIYINGERIVFKISILLEFCDKICMFIDGFIYVIGI